MRKRLAIAGHSDEGLALVPLLEANPDVEVAAILTDDRHAALRGLMRVEANLPDAYSERITDDVSAVLRIQGLVAIIDAEVPCAIRSALERAADVGVQVTTPLIAKLLYSYGPVDAARKPDLLQALGEILESYNLTVDRRGLLDRILQIAVGSTGADRGSLLLWDPESERLKVEVAIGIEREVIPKILLRPGEGIAGRAFADASAILVRGPADRERYDIVRERNDVESAISAPLIHDDRVLGVINLSHAHERGVFTEEDLEFVERLARIDAKIITRAEEYHRLLRDSARLRAQAEVRDQMAERAPLLERLKGICLFLAEELGGGTAQILLYDPELGQLVLRASSTRLDWLGTPLRWTLDDGIPGWVGRHQKPVLLHDEIEGARMCYAAIPLLERDTLLGVLVCEAARTDQPDAVLRDRIDAVADSLSDELFDALRAARMERDATKTGAINELAARMVASADSAELHRALTSMAAMILQAEHAVLRLQEPSSGRFQIRSYFGSAEPDAQTPLFELEKSLSISAIQQRAPLRIVDIGARADLAAFGADIQSALVQPLLHEGRVIGTLSLLEHTGADPLTAACFSTEDQVLIARLAEHAQQALAAVGERERTRHSRRFDELTGLANATHLAERIEQELARAGGRNRQVALIRIALQGLDDALANQEHAEADRLVMSIAQELRAGLRDFDVVARTAPDTFEILVPEPDDEISALIGPLARRIREAIRREPDPVMEAGLRLDFGYGVYPDEAHTPRALSELARKPRVEID